MEILKRKFEINELKNSDIRVGDVVNLPEFTVPGTIIDGSKELRFDEHTIKDTATVYDIRDNKLYLLFDHALFQSAIDLNNEEKWENTQLACYFREYFQPAMEDVGIPATNVALLSEVDMFGEHRLPFFKKAKNRIASDISEKATLSYWLKTSSTYNSSACFCLASYIGRAADNYASSAYSCVRPCFVIEL